MAVLDVAIYPPAGSTTVNRPGERARLRFWEGWHDMAKTQNYSAETREKAVRLVREHAGDYPSEYAAITAVAGRLGMTAETLRKWIRRSGSLRVLVVRGYRGTFS